MRYASSDLILARTYEGPLCLHELIGEQADRTPDRVAVTFEDSSLTYSELMERAGRLARHLRRLGVGPDVRVGVCAERSLEMVVGLLAVLQAGGAYVPLDPSYPADRLAFMVEDAAAPVVLTQRRLAHLLPPRGARTVLLDDPAWEAQDAGDALPVVPPDALAYVIYTSGSTGRPKGAMNAHRGVRNRLLWMRDDFGLGPGEVVLQKTPFSFDLSVWEIFATLMVGARLVMARPGGHQDSAYLVEVMEREGITIAHFVPSMLRAFLSSPGLERCAALRRVLCTGEAVSEDLERRFFERFGVDGPELYNLYGPTEAAVEVTWWQCGPGRSGPVPIGRPLPNTSIHLVGPDLDPVPRDGEGELLIGGIQPARGYHGRPDLTAEKFIPDPFGEPGSRLYRTGDLARYWKNGRNGNGSSDGIIEFLGRIDFQVKIRGYRIELGEIESVLGNHPAVHEAVVVARDSRLVAYVIAKGGGRVEHEALRSHLLERLPEYMAPADWVFLEALPLTSSGKIDRKALPEPESARPEHVPPRTPLERFLAALWEETLGVESVGLRDHFFELGGTSLSGAVVINRLQSETGDILHVVALFDAPTLAGLAEHLGREHRASVARVWGEESLPEDDLRDHPGEEPGSVPERVDEARLAELRALIQPLAPFPTDEPRNPPALFVLAPPRSGTTLMRVMLGGHPGLFSPPELELLTFNTMDERRAAFSGRDSFWLEGVLRAVMEARGCSLEEARELVEACEREGWSTRRFYRQLQEWVDGRVLVDKSTNYPLDPAVLHRAEEAFEEPFYIHLVRHPYGMIHSFEEAKIDQVFFRRAHAFGRRELAELIWTASQRNILAFLEGVPAGRQHRILFEDLVRDPEAELRRLCAGLAGMGIEYHPDMADPYKEKQARMTDGLHAEGRMLGDMKFHEHRGVEAGTAERWRQAYTEDFLGEPTWETAVLLGYPRSALRETTILPVPRKEGEPLPLSPAQERLWFVDRLVPGSPAYNACRELRLHGFLDASALGAALGVVVRRHEALRTVFRETVQSPVQVVLSALPVPLPVADLSGLPGPVRRAEARRISLAAARVPFDLRQGPMLRALLLRLEPGEHALRLDVHHIATDGWSMLVLQRELEALYRAVTQGGEPPPPLPVQYADYTLWQRRWMEREGPAQLEAWRLRLQGLPPTLELPADRPRPMVQSLRGGLERLPLPAELAERLEGIGRKGSSTLFMVLLAGFQTWLHRITGRDDPAVGVPSANRGRPEVEGLIGFFINNLVMSADLSGDPTFAEALGRVREAALFAYAHPDLPFERLVAELAPERDLSRTPIFQVCFSLQDPPPSLDFGGGMRGELADVHTGTSKFDLWLQVDREEAGWSVRAEYAADLFDASSVRRWLGQVRVLLEGIAAAPEARISELPLLTPQEREHVLTAWNRTEQDIPDEPAHRLFFQWAERTPDAPAVFWEGGSLTYAGLARRVQGLAGSLRRQGIGPETLVALRMERSPELVTAALAVLEVGAAYLPIDPSQPEERADWIVKDSGASLVLTADLLGGVEAPCPARRGGQGRGLPGTLAFVIYTSGSTGRPKGTELYHRGLSSLIAWHCRTNGLNAGDRSALTAGPGFDASVWETLAPLTVGAALCVPPRDVVLSPPALLAWMARQGVTVSFLPTPLAEAVLAEPLPQGLALRLLLTGGDRLRRRPAPDSPFELINVYGPTECTVFSTTCRVASAGERAPDIGSPVANTQVYMLDRSLRPVPVGVPGELCIAGEGLGRGYRARPALTAEKFIPNPFGSAGERLYRTGDLARWLPSGQIEFLGRFDHQVKIRGYRIELGEIETVLGQHPAVREAVVQVRDGRLVACVAPREAGADVLRGWLAERLPEVMIPSGWVLLEALPLTSNGKVDRRALALMEPEAAVVEGGWAPPETEMEAALAALWADFFGLERVGRHDDFFALGGHSLLAARLAFRVRERFGVDLPLRSIFEASTVAELAAVLAEKSGGLQGGLPLVAGMAPRPAPLSFAQQRLWFLDWLQPGSPVFNMPFVLRFAGPLDVAGIAVLAAALEEVVRRHEVLRTTLVLSPGGEEPVQVVAEPGPRALPVIDLSGLPQAEAEVGRLAAEEARRPFDLQAGPLLRTVLLQLSEVDYRLLLTMHHAVGDGWSVGVLLRELRGAYCATHPLPPLPVQYADFAVWQRRWLSGERLESQLAFWLDRLAGRDGATELPFDRPRPAVASLRGARESLILPAELLDAVESAGRRRGATPFVILLAAMQALVHRYTGQEDVVVGSPVAGRPRPEVEGLIGLFVNLLPLRARVDGDLPFAALLEQVRETALSALAHQDLPFERLVADLEPEHHLSRHPVFQLLLLLEEAPAAAGELAPGLTLAPPEEVPTGTAKVDLALALTGRTLEARYATDLFDAATMRRLLGHFRNLLHGIVRDGEVRVSDLPLLDAAEREQVLEGWNRTGEEIPEAPAHRLFFQWAERTPDAPAVFWEGGSLTYAGLARRVEGLAGWLRRQGIGPESLVALRLERSPELVTAALAALEAGAAYLPIDPSQPEERADWIVKDSGASLVLTADLLGGGVEAPPPARERSGGQGRGLPGTVAYVIYTSGSTGRPKGTELCHRGMSSLIAWHCRTHGLSPGDRSALTAGPGFDASVWETLAPLTVGAALCVPPRDVVLSPPALLAWMAKQGVTVSFLPTPLAEAVLSEPLPRGLALRLLLTGGDRLRRRPAQDAPFDLVNVYGPTECTVFSTTCRVSPAGEREPDIGSPVANTRIYMLDRCLQPVPVGVPGELCIAGEGLGRGYRFRPELTAEKFVPNPFGGAGERLYRTGDLARWLPSGRIEFLGRFDHQVKIRGYRIELGEIEAVLRRHPAVREAVVQVRDGRLVACVAPRETGADVLRGWLAERLPDVMIPSGWILLEALPLTSNGKVDRRALALMEPELAGAEGEWAPPETELEAALAAVWSQLLEVDRVGRHDDFFALGGHSLVAARLAFRVRELFGIDLPLRAVFEATTVAELAARLEEERRGPAEDDLPLASRPAPASFAQQRLWFLDRLQPGSPAFNMPFLLRFEGPLGIAGIAVLAAALEEVVRRHEVLRTTLALPSDGMEPVQVVAEPGPRALPVVDLSGLQGPEAEAQRLATAEARRPFDLEAGPLLRTALLRLSEEDHRLLLTMHHAVCDGWSVGVLLRELRDAFGAAALSPLPVQYADFAAWQRRWLSGERLEAQLAFWLGRLAGREGATELPSDRPRPAVASLRGAKESLLLPEGLLDSVERTGRRRGATRFMTLLAALQTLIHRYTGQEDLVVGSPVAGRPRPEVAGLIGLFVNLLPLRTFVDGGLSFGVLLERTREAVVSALAHPDLPFERLVADLEPERDLSRHPVFQLVLMVEDAPATAVELVPGLTLAPPEEVPTRTAKMDLVLSLSGRTLEARYATDLFDAATMRRLLDHFRTLLEGIGDEVRVFDLPLLDAAERDQVLVAWNRTEEEIPEEPVHRLFFQWAERTPGAPAVSWEGGSLTYAEMAHRAGELALDLVRRGAGPGTVVALCLERSPELVTAALAVLEAGGAYLPIDPAHPEERTEWIVRDSGASLLLTAGRLEEVEAPSPAGERSPDLAYVIYTSGSTGTPKGTELRHRGLSSLIAWHRRAYGLGPADRTTLLAGPGFDASVWETWAPLTAGAALHIPPAAVVLSPPALLAWMAEKGITVSFLPTPLAEAVLSEMLPKGLALRSLLTGGDRLRRRPEPGLPFDLINHYGPTESTVVATAGRVSPAGERAPEIGSPIANTRVYVLDRRLQPVPVGAIGELCLAGEGLARGYRGRPELTAERFVPDPFGGAGERLYRTGDLARWLPSGEVEFLGRADHQVKIRGHRIELGEIESSLARHPAVRDAVVLARDGRLVGYVAAREEVASEILSAWLARSLPGSMVPSAWVFLDVLPLTANGKVDRRALPAPAAPQDEEGFVPPSTATERALARIWCSLLGLEQVGRRDDFFRIGGHSLVATRVATRVLQRFGVDLELSAVFEQPTLAALAAHVDRLRGVVPSASAAEREASYPLSFAQQRLWVLDRLQPGSPAYNIPVQIRFAGPLQPATLAAALAEVVRRHAALRTTFAANPAQVIHPPAEQLLPVIELASLPEQVREDEAGRLAREEARRPFDLERGPLLRTTLLRLGAEEHRLLATMHHLVSDDRSMDVLLKEVRVLYGGQELPELPLQYPDFAVWQRSWLTGGELDRQLSWWRERLAAPPAVELPADLPRPAVWSYRGAVQEVGLPEGLGFEALCAGFLALLHRYTGQDDLLIGTPVPGRERAGTEELIGPFVNTLPLRVGLEGEPGFQDLVARVRESALAAFAHQDLPFERLVAELAPDRDLSRHPLFQAMFAFAEEGDPELEASHPGTARLDLSFQVSRAAGRLRLRMEHATDLFDSATVLRLGGHFRRLLEEGLAHPEVPVARLPLLSESERGQLAAWEQGERRRHPEGLLHGLFEAQARRTPEAVALVAGPTRLTYAELEERSSRLAQRLRAMGAGPEVGVAVCLERKADLVVALLAVLRAGSFYVPVDPRYPLERVGFVLQDSGAWIVVTESHLAAERLRLRARWLLLDRPETADPAISAEAAAEPIASNLAYLIYTSGSTGRPKAVAIEHRSAVALAHWARETFSPEELRGVLASTSITFDLSVFEIFVTLSWGGTVVLAENALELPAGVEITLVNAVPSAVAELLREDRLPLSVRTINLAGEALPRWLADLAYARPQTGRLCNLYGPSEDTTYSTSAAVERSAERPPSIGRPVHGTRACVLDRWQERVPAGVTGELYLAGEGLARGYLGRPGLTAERFVPDPFAAEPGSRMYGTGDLVRYRQDGELEFLGRLDHQVKVRGLRIELGEVEAVLARQPGVESAVVLAREDVPGDKRLVAYVVAPSAGGGGLSSADLRRALESELPEPMVPSAFVFLESLPLTPHGKVERRSLPAPGISPLETTAEFVSPRTPLEEEVAQAWAEVLGVHRIGVNDSFWHLGGHSLLATRALGRLESSFGVSLPLQTLFTAPTLEGFSSMLADRVLASQGEEEIDEAMAALDDMSEEEVRSLIEQTVRELEEMA